MTTNHMVEAVACPATTRILLVDERPIFRDGLTRVLELEPGLTVVGDAVDADEAIKAIAALKPDVLIVSLSDRPLARMVHALCQMTPAAARPRTILLATNMEKAQIIQSRHHVVHGILFLKEMSAEVLYDSVHSVAAGGCWIGLAPVQELSERLFDRAPAPTHRFGLTDRELEIIDAVRRGDTNKTIARQLSIAQDTVKHHLTNIYTKTGVFSRLQLAVFAIDNRLAHGQKMVEGGARTTAKAPPTSYFRHA